MERLLEILGLLDLLNLRVHVVAVFHDSAFARLALWRVSHVQDAAAAAISIVFHTSREQRNKRAVVANKGDFARSAIVATPAISRLHHHQPAAGILEGVEDRCGNGPVHHRLATRDLDLCKRAVAHHKANRPLGCRLCDDARVRIGHARCAAHLSPASARGRRTPTVQEMCVRRAKIAERLPQTFGYSVVHALKTAHAEPKNAVSAVPIAASADTGLQKSHEKVVFLPSADFSRFPKSITIFSGQFGSTMCTFFFEGRTTR